MNQKNNIQVAYGSARGKLHQARGIEYQDAILCTIVSNGIIAVIADGLGSKEYSKEAANAAVRAVLKYLKENAEVLNPENAEELLRQPLLEAARGAVAPIAVGRPMDCNLAFLAIFGDNAYIGHLGDCAVCVLDDDPRARTTSGSAANVTATVLTAVPDDLKIEVIPRNESLHGFILTTDGLEGVIYRKGSGWINKSAENYYNPVVDIQDSEKANKLLDAKVAELQDEFGDSYDDDISIIVVSCDDQKIRLQKDPTWRCLCGKRNPINVPYCLSCKQDRLQIYPYNEMMKELGQPHLDRFVHELEKDPQREYNYLTKAALRLGMALQLQTVDEPEIVTAPDNAEQENAPASAHRIESSNTESPPRNRRQDKPYRASVQQGGSGGGKEVLNAHVAQKREDHKQEPTIAKPVKAKKPKWTIALVVAAIAVCAVIVGAMLLLIGRHGPNVEYMGQTRDGKPHGAGVEYDGEKLFAVLNENGELLDKVQIDSVGIQCADGTYVYYWEREKDNNPTEGTTVSGTETTGPAETTEPSETTEPTNSEGAIEYKQGTIFIVTQTLKKGRMDPQTRMSVTVDLNYNDKVTAVGDPIQEADGIRWIHIMTENDISVWVDVTYLRLG